jgi:UPF0716 protein FxsA
MRLPLMTRLAILLYLLAEIAAFVFMVRWLGGWPVFWLVLAAGLLGGWLIQREGVKAWRAVGDAVRAGRTPDLDMASSRVRITAGLLLTLPGFVTDLLGLLLLLPVTRPLVRRLWAALLPPLPGFRPGGAPRGHAVRRDVPPSEGPVIEGEVVEGPVIEGEPVDGEVVDAEAVERDVVDGDPDEPQR